MVIFLSNSFLNRTVKTPEMAFTTVLFPWATCPIVPEEGYERKRVSLVYKREKELRS